jgi:hypothetical protein
MAGKSTETHLSTVDRGHGFETFLAVEIFHHVIYVCKKKHIHCVKYK